MKITTFELADPLGIGMFFTPGDEQAPLASAAQLAILHPAPCAGRRFAGRMDQITQTADQHANNVKLFRVRAVAIQHDRSDPFDKELQDVVQLFVQWCRVLTGQYRLAPVCPIASASGGLVPCTGEATAPFQTPMWRDPYFGRALTITAAQDAAARAIAGERVPAELQWYSNALHSLDVAQYEQSLVQAAMAAESAAAGALERSYEDALVHRRGDSTLRIVENPDGSWKDPVFVDLCRGTSFRSLIHERPLYLWGRSLLHDDPTTYQVLRSLYSARNKLVHRGELVDSAHLDATDADVERAVEAVSALHAWLGLPTPPSRSKPGPTMEMTMYSTSDIRFANLLAPWPPPKEPEPDT